MAALENADLHGLLDGLPKASGCPRCWRASKKASAPGAPCSTRSCRAERLADLRGKLVAKILEDRETLVAHMERALESGLKVLRSSGKVAEFPVERSSN
ncbi:MAG: hypothetical protein R3F17_03540 [Planctomycetota bacterium]